MQPAFQGIPGCARAFDARCDRASAPRSQVIDCLAQAMTAMRGRSQQQPIGECLDGALGREQAPLHCAMQLLYSGCAKLGVRAECLEAALLHQGSVEPLQRDYLPMQELLPGADQPKLLLVDAPL